MAILRFISFVNPQKLIAQMSSVQITKRNLRHVISTHKKKIKMDANLKTTEAAHLISSSFANIITTLAFGFSPSLLIILSNSSGFGSRGIFTDCEIHTLPVGKKEKKVASLPVAK